MRIKLPHWNFVKIIKERPKITGKIQFLLIERSFLQIKMGVTEFGGHIELVIFHNMYCQRPTVVDILKPTGLGCPVMDQEKSSK